MRLRDYLRGKVLFLAFAAISAGFGAFLLYVVRAEIYFTLFVPVIFFGGAVLSMLPEFFTKRAYYNRLYDTIEALDKRYLLPEVITRPRFYEGRVLYDVLKSVGKSMNDELGAHSAASEEYREYIELWVHEVKTPIAGAKLICENNGYSGVAAELDRIDGFVEQALFYSRSSHPEKDYVIRDAELSEIVNRALRKNARRLIEGKISIETAGLDQSAFTDIKWTDFMLQQVIDNAVKYRCGKIRIFGEAGANSVSLFVCDDGIGIPERDLKRIFDKGFTGENGRGGARSTGLGLYLCKKLCGKLGMGISVESVQGEYTQVEIVFPKSEMYI